jgi:hypothetical protein
VTEELTFQKDVSCTNLLGLYTEEIGLTSEQLGNFSQAFSHLALIGTAISLDCQLGCGAGNVAAARARSLVPTTMLEHLRWGA